MATDVIRTSSIKNEVLVTNTVAGNIRASQLAGEVLVTNKPGYNLRISQMVAEVIITRYTTYYGTLALTAGTAATVNGTCIRVSSMTAGANATATVNGQLITYFIGWGTPV